MTNELASVRNVLKKNQGQLLTRKNVVATGVGYKVTAGKKTSNLSIVCSPPRRLPLMVWQERT